MTTNAPPLVFGKEQMEKFKYTEVHLRSGKTALIGGTEWDLDGDTLWIYPDKDDASPVKFNWANVEMHRITEMDLPDTAQPEAQPLVTTAEPITEAEIERFRQGYL